MNEQDLFAVLPWLALLLVTVSVALAVVMRRDHARQSARQLADGLQGATNLVNQYTEINAGISKLQEKLAPLVAEQAASTRSTTVVAREEEEPSDERMEQFLDLVLQWERATGQRLQGAATADWETIDALTVPGRPRERTEDTAIFLAAARRVVEYAVRASGSRALPLDEEQVSRVLNAMAALAELKLIEPQLGQRYNSDLHDVVDKVTAEASNRRETIAKVEVRGLVRRDGSVMKAKVYLYD